MAVRLWEPDRRSMAGVSLGDSIDQVLNDHRYVEDPEPEEDTRDRNFQRFDPDVIVRTTDDVVYSVSAFDECYLDEVNLIGLNFDFAKALLGGEPTKTEDLDPVEIHDFATGAQLYVMDGTVTQVHIQDWSLIID